MKLYEMANNFQHVLQLAEAGGLDEKTVKDTLESISGEFSDKSRNCMMIVRQLESDGAGIKAEIDRLKSLQEQNSKAVESLKDYIKFGMESVGSDKLDLGIFKLTLKKPTKAVEITDESKIPDSFWRIIPETKSVDKSELSAALKSGEVIDGAKLVDGKRALLIK